MLSRFLATSWYAVDIEVRPRTASLGSTVAVRLVATTGPFKGTVLP